MCSMTSLEMYCITSPEMYSMTLPELYSVTSPEMYFMTSVTEFHYNIIVIWPLWVVMYVEKKLFGH